MKKRVILISSIFCYFVLAIFYILVRTISLRYAHYAGIDKFCAILLLSTECYVAIHTVGYLINVIQSYRSNRTRNTLKEIADKNVFPEPSVAILIPARHEPKEVLHNTLMTIQNMSYSNKTVYLLDDSSDETYKKQAEELAKSFNVKLFRREKRHGAKAGIVNDCLKVLSETYVVIFDSDQCPFPEFLNKMVAIMEHDDRLALVQTPQFYINVSSTRVSRAATHQQCVFYEYICEGKSYQDAMFCCGTNFILRKKAIDEVGGFDEQVVTEDFSTSLKLHQQNWKSLYYDHALAFGLGPENLESYFKQQFRWTHGMISVLRRLMGQCIRHPLSMKLRQWWEYFISSSYFLIGLSFFIFNLFPILFIFFDIASFYATPQIYLFSFLPYILFSLTIFYSMLHMRGYRIKDLFGGQLLIQIAFPVQIKATISAMLGIKTEFTVTSKEEGGTIPYWKLWPQMLLMVVNYSACIWALNRYVYEGDGALLINGFWALYHSFILSSIFYFNQPNSTDTSI